MTFGSIRFRLTAWYFLSLAVILTLFGFGARFAMQTSIFDAIDHDLRTRIQDVQQFIERQMKVGPKQLINEFREQSMLGAGGSLLQVCDETGAVLYRSARLSEYPLGLKQPCSANARIAYATDRMGHSSLRIASQAVTVQGKRFTIEVAEPMHEFEESMERFQGMLLVAAPLFLVLASLGGFWMSRRALAPVDRITRDARLISISNLSRRLEVPSAKDELQRLTQTLNEMLDRIDKSVRRMVQFTADASHELRAPLTLIHTAAEFSLRRERKPEELREAMRKVVRESERTASLVDDLLVLARADSGTDELRVAPVDLVTVSHNVYEQVLTLAKPKRIQVSIDAAEEAVSVQGDEQALSRLFLILLDNAVKYTPEGGQICFQVRTRDSHAEAIIRDTGIGIASEDLPHIYDRFWRADKVRSRNLGGAGLGLSIALWIVEQHGGEIEAHSEVGKGSEFRVRLPLIQESVPIRAAT
jgi:heavy metal sensor kinase